MSLSTTTVTLLTPSGRSAIATLAVRGPHAVAAVERCFQPVQGVALQQVPAGRILFGEWRSTPEASEELVLAKLNADHVEIHCHGGHSAVAAILQSLAEQGVLTISAEEFAPAVAENLLAAEAWLALAHARTERTATHLLAQLQGALAEACALIQQAIHQQEQNRAVSLCEALLSRAALGRHLTEPWRVVLAGEPNVGKSSLMNALMGYSRSIVFAEPGTTRDVVSALTAFAGWPIELLDTAGLRETSDAIESAGVKLAEAQLATADLILLVTDASAAWSAENAAIRENYEHVLVVLNKSDLLRDPAASKIALSGRETCLVSALSGNGLEELGDRIAKRLVPEQPEPGAAIPFTARQTQLLTLAHSAIKCGDWPQAREVFTKLIGG